MQYYQLDSGDFKGEMPKQYYEFKYKVDHFQNHSFKAINDGNNVLVTAHTGAGKTAVALHAIAKHLQSIDNNIIIYTSPIKTLSNQKYKDFSEDFDDVGIMTGDVKINPTAKLMIMTAEILRNAILRKENKDNDVYDWNFDSSKIKLVILDEVHFINNPDRGMVWEEIITNLDPSVQLVMLSATINGADKLAKWVGNIKKIKCHHIPTPYRPVPLKHHVFWNDKLHLMLEGDSKWHNGNWDYVRECVKKLVKNNKFKSDKLYMEKLILYLQKKKELPVTIFLLNKKMVEKTAENIQIVFNTHEERKNVEMIWHRYLQKYKNIYENTTQWNMIKSLVLKGIAIHHSGLIPVLKEIIEILYSVKLIKVLIATETFAMGVNMPTKTTIFTQLTKYDGNVRRLYYTEEYIQMAGRAGRRGIDKYGTVVILPSKYMEGERDIHTMMTGKSKPLKSHINLDYNYLLKQLYYYENSDTKVSIDSINNTYFGSELNKMINYDISKKEELEKKLSHMEYDIEILTIFNTIEKNNKLLNKNDFISLNRKQIKKLKNENANLQKQISTHDKVYYNNIIKLKQEILDYENNINTMSNSIEQQINILLEFVKTYNFVDDMNNLTVYGKIMSQVNECNPMILGYMIENKVFSGLKFEEIAAILSVFIDDISLESESIDNLLINKELKDKMYQIDNIINEFIQKEDELNNILPYPIRSDWYLYINLFPAILEWGRGKQWSEISYLYPTFEGNFIKNVLRLTNLIKNVYSIAKNIKDIELINTLEGFEEKLIRDFVTIDSLYL
jgi:ATP-dependent RNA helicase DOB1